MEGKLARRQGTVLCLPLLLFKNEFCCYTAQYQMVAFDFENIICFACDDIEYGVARSNQASLLELCSWLK